MLHYLAAALSLASAASAAVTTVTVGAGGIVFTPNSITAQNGDVVNFKFTGAPGNHTVSQAAFAAPCAQLANGFDSGFVSVPSGFSGAPMEWNLTVSDASTPIWFYCKQRNPTPHCLGGMVGAINPPSSGNTLANFESAAKALSSLPAQTAGSLSGVGASASSAPSVSGGSGSASSSPAASGTSSGASASSTAPSSASPSASATHSSAAFKASTGSLWTLLAGVLGIIIA